MGHIAHRTTSPSQSAFIKGHIILDGILSLHVIFHDLRVKNTKVIILKLDFEKAYDSVRCPFLHNVLLAKGFDGVYVYRLMLIVQGDTMRLW